MTAQRIQRRRTKGWRMPDGAVYVGRPTKWGNPFRVDTNWQGAFRAVALVGRGDRAGQRAAAVKLYRMWLTGKWRRMRKDTRTEWEREVMTVSQPPLRVSAEEIRRELRGRDLICWCPLDQPCHADVLLEVANA